MEEPEYRIYASECGQEAVARDICGEEALKHRLAEVRNAWPNSQLVVSEVLEKVITVYPPHGPPIHTN